MSYATIMTGALRVNPCPAEPRYILPLQTVSKKPTDLDLHCLPFSM